MFPTPTDLEIRVPPMRHEPMRREVGEHERVAMSARVPERIRERDQHEEQDPGEYFCSWLHRSSLSARYCAISGHAVPR